MPIRGIGRHGSTHQPGGSDSISPLMGNLDFNFYSALNLKSAMRVVNVKGFGAKGDGVTDDTSAIQSAIDSLGGNPGMIVGEPDDVYLVSYLLYSSNLIFDMRGATLKSKVLSSDEANRPILKRKDDTVSNVIIKNVIFDGNGSAQSYTVDPALYACDDMVVYNCVFRNFNGRTDGGTSTIDAQGRKNVKILYNKFMDLGYVGSPSGVRDVIQAIESENLLVEGNYIKNYTDTGVAFNRANNVIIKDNILILENVSGEIPINGFASIGAANAENITIENNIIDAYKIKRGIWLQPDPGYRFSNVTVKNNRLKLTDDSACGTPGMYLIRLNNLTVTQNHVTHWGYTGIQVEVPSGDVAITENIVEKSDLGGIYVVTPEANSTVIISNNITKNNYQNRGNLTYSGVFKYLTARAGIGVYNDTASKGNIIITGNASFDNQETATQPYGIAIPGIGGTYEPVNRLVLISNIIYGVTTEDIFVAGGGNPNWHTPVECLRIGSNAPSAPVEGDIYWDSTAGALKVYNGSAWETISSA